MLNSPTPSSDPLLPLWRMFQQGDQQAFVQLYEKLEQAVLCWCRLILRSSLQAEDAAQSTWLRVCQNRDKDLTTSVGAWIRVIATNEALQIVRRRQSQSVRPLESYLEVVTDFRRQSSTIEEPAEIVQRAETCQQVQEAIRSLSTQERRSLELRYVDKSSRPDIGSQLGLSVEQVKNKLEQAKKHFRDNWPGWTR